MNAHHRHRPYVSCNALPGYSGARSFFWLAYRASCKLVLVLLGGLCRLQSRFIPRLSPLPSRSFLTPPTKGAWVLYCTPTSTVGASILTPHRPLYQSITLHPAAVAIDCYLPFWPTPLPFSPLPYPTVSYLFPQLPWHDLVHLTLHLPLAMELIGIPPIVWPN